MSNLPAIRSVGLPVQSTPALRRVLTRAGTDLELMDEWISRSTSPHTRRGQRLIVERFLAKLHPLSLKTALPADAAAACRAACEGASLSSTNSYSARIKAYLRFALARRYIEDDISQDIIITATESERAATVRQRIITAEDVAEIIKAARSRRDRILLGTMYSGGLRVAEVARLIWANVLLTDGRVQLVVHGKGSRNRLVLLDPVASAALLKYRGEAYDPAAPVFCGPSGKSLAERTITIMVKRCARRAKVELASRPDGRMTSRVSAHWLRHAHASNALQSGKVSLAAIRKTLGHANVATTNVYLHAGDKETSADGLSAEVLKAMDEA
jgi:integrase/recombinase XerD